MEAQALTSRIESVVVHRDGAVVTRLVSLPGLEAQRAARVTGLPLLLDDASIRLAVTGPAVALDVRVALEASSFAVEAPDEDERRRAAAEVTRLENLLVHVDRVRAMVERTSVYRRPQPSDSTPPIEVDVAARLGLLDFRIAEMERLAAERATVARDLERAQIALREVDEKLRRREGDRAPKPDELRKAAVFTLRSNGKASALELRLSYSIAGARWAPAYALYLDKKGGKARLDVRAVIAQSTGEDWSNVALSLSSAPLLRHCELPELTSLRIGRAQPPPKRAYRPPPGDVGILFGDFERAVASVPGAVRPLAAAEPMDLALGHDETTPTNLVVQTAVVPPPGAALSGAFAVAAPMSASAPVPRMAPSAPPPPMQAMPLRAKARLGHVSNDFARADVTVDALSISDRPTPPPRLQIEPDDRLLSFGDLRLGPPGASSGSLRVARRDELYLEASATLDVKLGVKVSMALHAAGSQLRQSLATPLPARHVAPLAVGGFDAVYEASAPVDVPADGDFHAVAILSASAASALSYVVVPREASDVFRRVEVTSPLDVPLLPGPCDVYADGGYLLASDIEGVAAHGRIALGLGVDQSVKVARNVWHNEQTAGIMGGSLVLKHQIKVELVSHKAEAIPIEVRERVPVPAENQEDVKVEVVEVKPPWAPWEPAPSEPPLKGGYAWRIKLEPKAKVELEAVYTVRIPAKLELVGGNRRD